MLLLLLDEPCLDAAAALESLLTSKSSESSPLDPPRPLPRPKSSSEDSSSPALLSLFFLRVAETALAGLALMLLVVAEALLAGAAAAAAASMVALTVDKVGELRFLDIQLALF